MPEFPFALQCTIPENQLIGVTYSVGGCLFSTFLTDVPGIEYGLSIYPRGHNYKCVGTLVFLRVRLLDVKKVKANFTISIESANFSKERACIFEESGGLGTKLANAKEFFDLKKNFFFDGNFTVKINGTFKYENVITSTDEEQKWEGAELGDELWEKDESKDFTIVADGKEMKVHKLILGSRSEVFSAMLKPYTKESNESKVEIPDFSFNVVEAAVKLIYQSNFITSLSLDEMMSLLQFFDKYNLPSLKDKIEVLLIDKISATTVCRFTNCSILTNSMKLKKECTEFLMVSFTSKTALADIEILDKEIDIEVLQNSVYRTVEICSRKF